MPKYIAFLRAINVGGHTVKMDQLRRLFESLDFSNVETFIASGNVIFDSPSKSTKAIEKKIEDRLQGALGYRVTAFIRTTAELAAIANYEPFKAAKLKQGGTVYIGFLSNKPDNQAKKRLLSLTTETDEFHLDGREVYWLLRAKFSESKISGALLEKSLGMPATFRNSNTVRNIAAKYSRSGLSNNG